MSVHKFKIKKKCGRKTLHLSTCADCSTNTKKSDHKYDQSCVMCHVLPVTCYLLPVTCYLLPVTCYLLPVFCYLLPVPCYLLPVTCYLLSFTRQLSPVTCCQSPVNRYLNHTLCSFKCYKSPKRFHHAAAEVLVVDNQKEIFLPKTKKIKNQFFIRALKKEPLWLEVSILIQ